MHEDPWNHFDLNRFPGDGVSLPLSALGGASPPMVAFDGGSLLWGDRLLDVSSGGEAEGEKVKEYPILFQGAMVQAILEERKTETRRIMKAHPGHVASHEFVVNPELCPYGQPDDRLWVREKFCFHKSVDHLSPKNVRPNKAWLWYPADKHCNGPSYESMGRGKMRPSIFMPRWASRILLDITETRVEPVQEITAKGAINEGLSKITKDDGRTFKYGLPDSDGYPGTDDFGWPWSQWEKDPVQAFKKLWNSINAKPKPVKSHDVITHYESFPWDLESADPRTEIKGVLHYCFPNPWVWVVKFRRIES